MRVMSKYLRGSLPPFVAGACAAATAVAIDTGDFPMAAVLLLAAGLLIARGQLAGGRVTKREVVNS